MTPTRKRRLAQALFITLGVALAVSLLLFALGRNLLYFHDPSAVAAGEAPVDREFRLGGLVKAGSVQRTPGSLEVRFVVTDLEHETPVVYTDILPDLFREGQGVIARGRLNDRGIFEAREVLAKHDETYMPPEVADSLREKGHPGR